MAYISTLDERYGGSYYSYYAGYNDAPATLNSSYYIKQDSLAYGTLTFNNFTLDQDVYSLGTLSTGYYKVDLNDQTWDYNNFDAASVASFSVLDSGGIIIGTTYGSYADISFTVNSSNIYYVKLTGTYYGSAQYNLSYTKTGELTNITAVFGQAIYSGSAVVGNYVGVSTTYYDDNGNSDNTVGISWYLDGVYQGFTDSTATLLILPEYLGKTLSSRFYFYDDLGNYEISNFYVAGQVLGAFDTTAPTVTTFSPADEATGVGVASKIILTFSESVVASSGGTIELMTDYGSGHQSVEVFSVGDATRVTISGNVVTIDPTSALLPSTGYHLGFNNALADNAGNAFSYTHGQYNFTTTAAVIAKTVSGTAGNDILTGGGGNDTLDGGAGTDTVVFSGNRASYTISQTSTGSTVSSTAEGVDTLANVERLKFADTAIALDTSGVGGQAYRLYQAAFNRTPDLEGLGYWIGRMDIGDSLKEVAKSFVNSAEFKLVYGASPTNAQIVTRFYDNVLHRAAESGGYNYWLGALNSGQDTVAEVLASFSESPENQAGVIGVIGNGISYTPFG